ncbi:MAG: hypothetical protein ABWZ52_02375 [Acidimicrobiales bacterium]
MSDQSQGPGWWLASDGKWYPPDQAPAVPPPETWAPQPPLPQPSPSGGMSSGAKVGLIVGLSIVALLVVVVAAALLLGDDSSSSSSEGDGGTTAGGAVEVPEGFALLEGDGVSIAAPDDWQEIAPEDFAMSPEEFADAFPDAPEGMFDQGAAFLQEGAVLVAFEFTSEFASNVNILDAPGEAPLDDVEGQVEGQLSSLGAEIVSVERVDLPVGESVRVGYVLDVALPDGGTIPANGVQYYVPFDGRTYIITISSDEDIAELADVMAETFRVG